MALSSRCNTTSVRIILCCMLLVAAESFVVLDAGHLSQHPAWRISPTTTSAMTTATTTTTLVNVVADYYEEKEQQRTADISSNNIKPTDAWIQTESGGFLPNLNRHKLFRRRASSSAPTTTTTTRNKKVAPSSKIIQIDGIDDYREHVVEEKDRLICVRFHAPYCRACKAVTPAFRKMASIFSSRVKFVDVPVNSNNVYLHQGLGIPSLPFVHLYHPEFGLVEEGKIGKKRVPQFRQTLAHYVRGCCDLADNEDEEDD